MNTMFTITKKEYNFDFTYEGENYKMTGSSNLGSDKTLLSTSIAVQDKEGQLFMGNIYVDSSKNVTVSSVQLDKLTDIISDFTKCMTEMENNDN